MADNERPRRPRTDGPRGPGRGPSRPQRSGQGGRGQSRSGGSGTGRGDGDKRFERRADGERGDDRRGSGDKRFERRADGERRDDRRGSGDKRFERRGGDKKFERRGGGDNRFERRGGRDRRDGEPSDDRPVERDPALPEDLDLDLKELPRGMKAELRGLPPEIADKVGLRLMAAGLLIDTDPGAAYAQVKVARRLAARLPVVRAAVAETAYAAGDYHAALTDYRALRRMSGGDEYLPVLADCERALGRPEEALRIAKEAASADLDPASAIEMVMVEAGARADLGQRAEALRLLERKIRDTQRLRVNDTSKARLRYAYADQLAAQGERDQAREWFVAAAKLDSDGATDAEQRVAEIDGLVIDFDDSEFEDSEFEESKAVDDVDAADPPAEDEDPADPSAEES